MFTVIQEVTQEEMPLASSPPDLERVQLAVNCLMMFFAEALQGELHKLKVAAVWKVTPDVAYAANVELSLWGNTIKQTLTYDAAHKIWRAGMGGEEHIIADEAAVWKWITWRMSVNLTAATEGEKK